LIVLDASLMAAWLFGERPSPALHVYNALPDVPIVVPAHWPIEISNALRTNLRAGRISVEHFQLILKELDRLVIHVEPAIDIDDIVPLAHFAEIHNVTAYDAAYLQLAIQQRAILATLDEPMRSAARALSVAILPT
jgi:predicted nucleic acid-binding protein